MIESFPEGLSRLPADLDRHGIPAMIASGKIQSIYKSALPDNYDSDDCAEMNVIAFFRHPEDPPDLFLCLHDFNFGRPRLARQIEVEAQIALTNTEEERLFWRARSQFPQTGTLHKDIHSCIGQLQKNAGHSISIIPFLEMKLFLDYYWME